MNLKTKRVFMCVFGTLIAGVAVGFLKVAAFGVDPFQSLMAGINNVIPISFGTLYMIVNLVLLLFSFIADRHYIGISTFINLFLLGYVVEFSHATLLSIFPDASIVLRAVFLVIGIVVLCIASSLYFSANLGVSTYDAIALIISNTWKLIQFKYCRIITDFICVAIGGTLLLLSGYTILQLTTVIGIGTIITAFFMGPLIDFFIKHLAAPILKEK